MPTTEWQRVVESLMDRIEKLETKESNKELLKRFQKELLVNNYSYARIQKLLSHLIVIFRNFPDIDFEKATAEEIKEIIAWVQSRELSPETRRDYKVALRVFYKWIEYGSVKDRRAPSVMAGINVNVSRREQKLPDDILSEEDIRSLIKNATNSRAKCLIALLWETGARMGEIIDLKVRDIKPWKYGYQVVLRGKTGSRRVPLIVSEPYINEWLDEHPLKDCEEWPDVWLWVHIRDQNHGKGRIMGEKADYHSLIKDIRRAAKKAGISKPVNPHNFRHSRATFLANYFTEAQMNQWFGWVPASRMPSLYVHLSGRDIDIAYATLHGLDSKEERMPKLVPKKCPRCELGKIPAESKFCPRCGAPLDPRVVKEVEEAESKVFEAFASVKDEDVLKMLEFVSKLYRIAKSDAEVLKILREVVG
ncbi:site-specific integrase [Archaeoglobus sp.]|uniref:site-specific integrase n=1 Tax=Archaeoglobus sp. TaxID=1872626 RepID=UPI0024AC5E6D|nr:site-specific integrase [Archaeoglobus sp.]MDI3497930.1 integrase/recombinase XerD [Archaeoglobus sp.]